MTPSFSYNYFYHWATSCLPLALMSGVIIWSSRCAVGEVMFLVWMQLPIYLLHQAEEHFWPGGFKQFLNKKVFYSSANNSPFDDIDIFLINIPFIWILFPLMAVVAQHANLGLGSFLPVFGLVNAMAHVIGWLIKRCYNPGLIVSLLLNIPTGLYTLTYMLNAGLITSMLIMVMVLIAVVIHVGMVVFALIRYKMHKRTMHAR